MMKILYKHNDVQIHCMIGHDHWLSQHNNNYSSIMHEVNAVVFRKLGGLSNS